MWPRAARRTRGIAALEWGFEAVICLRKRLRVAPILGVVAGLAAIAAAPASAATPEIPGFWVTNQQGNSVAQFIAGTSGNVAPIRKISGLATQLAGPMGSLWTAPVTCSWPTTRPMR
jgi:hypothetical protein